MENIDAIQLIRRSNENPERWNRGEPSPEFYEDFSAKVKDFIVLSSSNFPKTQKQEHEESEGKFGVLPPPARREIAKAILSSEPIPPLRSHEEAREQDPEILVNTVYLHT